MARAAQAELEPLPEERPSEPQALQVAEQSTAMIQMIERVAANPAVDVDKLERLLQMQERVLAHQAEAAFNEAFSQMQPRIPTVVERGKTDKASYAKIEDIIEAVRPVLSEFGFSLSHQTEWPESGGVRVTGILTHRSGHSRRSTFQANADTSGSKNAIQALGSSVAYGKRYTTKDLLCIVTRGEDDDGHRSEAPAPPDGYDKALAKLQAVAMQGTAALEAAWQKAPAAFKNYTVKHNKAAWESMKVAAARGTGGAR